MAVYTDGTHVVATTLEELHEFAYDKLGYPAKWFQGYPRHKFPHYDTMAQSKKKLALKQGAILVEGNSFKERAEKIVAMFRSGQLESEIKL